MRPVPIQPMQMPPEDRGKSGHRGRGTALSPAQWLRQHVLAQEEETIASLGELLLPTLLGAMEACWVCAALIGLASAHLFGFSTPLLPLWSPFVYIIGFHWTLVLRERRVASIQQATSEQEAGSKNSKDGQASVVRQDMPLFFVMLVVLALFLIWLQIYAPTRPLYDLTWLATLGSDTLFLDLHFYQALMMVLFSCYLCWRGLRLLSHTVEPSQVIRGLLLGLGVIIAAILLLASVESSGATSPDAIFLFMLIPVFLFLSLVAHALARIVFVRKSHFSGLQGSVVAQERAVITVVASLGIILLLVTLLVGLFADPTFFSSALSVLMPVGIAIGNAYNWLVGIFADILVFLATPIFWLFTFLGSLLPHGKPGTQNIPKQNQKQKLPTHPITNINAAWLPFLRVGLLLVLLLGLVCLVWWAVQHRRRKVLRLRRKDADIHESLWSWLLLWNQVKNILRALFGRFSRYKPRAETQVAGAQGTHPSDPAVRTIREIYRAVLKKAAGRGYQRKKYETPLELRQRLDEGVPLVEPQLESITEAYSMVRYGDSLPNVDDVIAVGEQWRELDQKWV
ncbi:MAG TPA: DUF4129 domain-containing protein [Ktedonobacteraceae bacterium]|nr:DUF4129 domain-containing protein [Ktedonobacteraceae bacterium]